MLRIGWVILIGLALSAGCASREPAPDWLHSDVAPYSARDYLTGRGAGPDAAAARDRARADLAKVFEVRIQETLRDRSAQHSDTAGVVAVMEVERELEMRLDRVISGVQIAAQWYDRDTDRYHALAVLDRAQASRDLRTEIEDLDTVTAGYIDRARSGNDLFVRLRNASQAVAAQEQRAELQRNLQVVERGGEGVPVRWRLGRLHADYAELLMRISVRPEASGHYAAQMIDTLSATLRHAGLTVTSAAEYAVVARLDIEELAPRDGWYWRSGILRITLRDSTGASVGTHRWMLREAATDEAIAEQRVVESAQTRLERELAEVLMHLTE